jgi:hypothetical protein
MDEAARQLGLVYLALRSGLSNCVEWINEKATARVRNDPANQGLTPEGIRRLLLDFVRQGGQVEQRVEERQEWKNRREFWFRVVVPVAGFPHGLFVEMELADDDPDVPAVSLLRSGFQTWGRPPACRHCLAGRRPAPRLETTAKRPPCGAVRRRS